MAKQLSSSKPTAETTSAKPLIPEKFQDVAYCAALCLSVLVFLGGALFGNGFFNSSDNIASYSFEPYLQAARQSGKFPLWIPYIFSGLPSYGSLLITGDRWWDFIMVAFQALTKFVGGIFGSDTARVSTFYMVYGCGMYALMRSKKHDRFTAFFTGFAGIFSTWVITWVMIGHNSKPMAFSMFPFVLLALEKLREKFSLLYVAILIVAVHILVESAHVQMTFYGVLTFGLYLLFELGARVARKESPMPVVRAGLALALAGAIAFGMGADRYLSTLEYTSSSTRGTAPIVQNEKSKQDASGGFDYEYSTNWSFSPEETITFIAPNYYGFGHLPYSDSRLTRGEVVHVPTYWGQMPFTDAANYMGIGVLLLAIVGFVYYRKDVFVQFLLTLAVFALFLSFGKNFSLVYDVFFYYVPMFNKFRAPSMALAMTQFAIPILAGFGIAALRQIRRDGAADGKKTVLVVTGISAAYLVIGFLYTTATKESYIAALEASQLGARKYPAEIFSFIQSQMASDMIVTALLGVVFMTMAYLYVNGKIKQTLLYSGFALLLVTDLWRVAYRAQDISKQDPRKTVFKETDVVQFLKSDKSQYRIADFAGQSPNLPARFLFQNIHGYHSAKLRVYQDLLDVAGNGGGSMIANPFLWNLLNVKYIIADQPLGMGIQPIFQSRESKEMIFANPSALPRAFFVGSAQVAQPMEILNHLKNGDFNPQEIAYLETALPEAIERPSSSASVSMTNFENELITFDVNATGKNFVFVSEVYFKGWKAFLDGQEIPIHKTNYAFRGVVVPAGKHTLEMRFESPGFERGKTISLAGNIVTIALLGVGLFLSRKQAQTKNDE